MLTLSLLPGLPDGMEYSIASVTWALYGVLEQERQRLLEQGIAPTTPVTFQDQLTALGTSEDQMLRDDIAVYAQEVVKQPILLLQVSPDLQSFPMAVQSFGDLREAASPGGMALDKVAIYSLSGNHYSLLVPTSDLRLGYSEQAYPDASYFQDLGHFTVMAAGECPLPVLFAYL